MNIKKRFTSERSRYLLWLIASILLLGLFPLLGPLLRGESLWKYFEFPPITVYVSHPKENITVFVLGVLFFFLLLLLILLRLISSGLKTLPKRIKSPPCWSYAGVILLALSWCIAWNGSPVFECIRPFYFFPLWSGFILFLNGICEVFNRQCPIRQNPVGFFLLFPTSACFWWYFEYLNRFCQNWHYLGVEHFSPLEYSLLATLAFSTVLPAVVSVAAVLEVFFDFKSAFGKKVCHPATSGQKVSIILLILSGAGMVALGFWPEFFFPVIWLSPMLTMLSVEKIIKGHGMLDDFLQGRWEQFLKYAISGLVCGFFWEMWNFKAWPKWIYMIPYVGQFKIFEMPLLGYAGYLPFGVECGFVASIVLSFNDKSFGVPDGISKNAQSGTYS